LYVCAHSDIVLPLPLHIYSDWFEDSSGLAEKGSRRILSGREAYHRGGRGHRGLLAFRQSRRGAIRLDHRGAACGTRGALESVADGAAVDGLGGRIGRHRQPDRGDRDVGEGLAEPPNPVDRAYGKFVRTGRRSPDFDDSLERFEPGPKSGAEAARCAGGSFASGDTQDLVAGWQHSGVLTCAVTFSLADPRSLPPGAYTGMVDFILRAE
jgi:hypothetical protein